MPKNETDLIFTYVYEGSGDDDNVREFIKTVEDNKGEVFFVELSANRDDLVARVVNDSRKRYKNPTGPEIMKTITEDMNIYSIPFVKSLKIDTSALSSDKAAAVIVENL